MERLDATGVPVPREVAEARFAAQPLVSEVLFPDGVPEGLYCPDPAAFLGDDDR